MCAQNRDYFARHYHIFKRTSIARDSWEKIRITYHTGVIDVYKNDLKLFSIYDSLLTKGYAFLGLKGGEVYLRNIEIRDHMTTHRVISEIISANSEYEVLHDSRHRAYAPVVSIITTVYDRTDCLRNCIRSIRHQTFRDYEHIIISDSPGDEVIEELRNLVTEEDKGFIMLVNLAKRFNDWGMTPASVGIGLSQGKYICFLSDDNGYSPEHIKTLVDELEKEQNLGFVYSSCMYDGRRILDSPIPRPAGIDLGQPLFRRKLFMSYFQDGLPFKQFAWDWQMIDTFMKGGVRWKHINMPTFFFRLKKYPEVLDTLNREQEKSSLNNHNPLAVPPLLFSLIHPSRGRANKAKETYNLWISKMSKTNGFQHLLALDKSDPELNQYKELFEGETRMVISETDCVVQATNEAAKQARGDVLIYLSDDFDCPDRWDTLLVEEINKRHLNPGHDKFILKVDDCLQPFTARVLTIPIMSKRLYDYLGYFWYHKYRSMFCDQDLFEVCDRLQAIVKVPHLRFQHKHYSIEKAKRDSIYRRSEMNWTQGKKIFSVRKGKNYGF
jgi:glycosyltransferase involved in cell wall biosynthesis